ncbi:hypothetical protein DFH06DRAFT_1208630 [Mycena polygramma]|nr:hypothetical protein DFH06DRAFT_1208630 [Mycena polygramma]
MPLHCLGPESNRPRPQYSHRPRKACVDADRPLPSRQRASSYVTQMSTDSRGDTRCPRRLRKSRRRCARPVAPLLLHGYPHTLRIPYRRGMSRASHTAATRAWRASRDTPRLGTRICSRLRTRKRRSPCHSRPRTRRRRQRIHSRSRRHLLQHDTVHHLLGHAHRSSTRPSPAHDHVRTVPPLAAPTACVRALSVPSPPPPHRARSAEPLPPPPRTSAARSARTPAPLRIEAPAHILPVASTRVTVAVLLPCARILPVRARSPELRVLPIAHAHSNPIA